VHGGGEIREKTKILDMTRGIMKVKVLSISEFRKLGATSEKYKNIR